MGYIDVDVPFLLLLKLKSVLKNNINSIELNLMFPV